MSKVTEMWSSGKETVREFGQKMPLALKAASVGMTSVGFSVSAAMVTLASEPSVPAGENLLAGETLTLVQKGFNDLVATGTAVIGLAVVAGISVIGISAAASYAMKKIKGILSQAK